MIIDKRKRLQADYEQMMQLVKSANPVISFITQGKDDPPTCYLVDINVKSVVGIVQGTDTAMCKSRFQVRIDLSGYPEQLPRIRFYEDSPVPFHPFVKKPLFLPASWVDSSPYDPKEGLGNIVRRLVLSLQYAPGSILPDPAKIQDDKAWKWYSTALQTNPGLFPIDKQPLPPPLQKITFDVLRHNSNSSNMCQKPAPTTPLSTQGVNASTTRSWLSKPLVSTPAPIVEPIATPPAMFKVNEVFEHERPEKGEWKPVEVDEQLSSITATKEDDQHHIYITQRAKEQIFNHIEWDKKTFTNANEQGGILIGRVFHDIESGKTWGIVKEAIAGDLARGSSAYLEMDHATWWGMYQKVDDLLEKRGRDDLYIIGWYHTHPNNLDVFMSGTDQATQSRMFAKDWQFAIVLNPQRKIWRAFHGAGASECRGELLKKISGEITLEESQSQ